ncbi:O-antigen ligase family protein [Maribacter chungangensis]|uniref:O-antigen ligase family protein n=1 Tax=Maribacter chungangensis TaxID=1069117 RepID=A0ABW3B3G0_9FLAO
MKITKTILPYLFIFFLIYWGPTSVGPTTFSQVWKLPLFGFLIWQIVVIRNREKPGFIKWSYARAAKNLVTGGFSVSYVAGIIDFVRYMMFPLMYEYAALKLKGPKNLDKILLGFAQFIIISGIPFVLGLLQTKAKDALLYKDFDSYGGMFQNTHGAAITTTTAVLILLAFLKLKSSIIKYKKLNYALLVFGIYLIYLTFIRTGYAMFFIGLVFIFMPKKLSIKQIVSALVAIAVLVFGFFYLLETNETFYNRIFDIRNGKQTAAGSGRLLFWKASFDLWFSGNMFEIFFGFGYEGLLDKIGEVTGIRVYAHNEFFTQLGQNGLLGVTFFIGYLISLFKFIWKRRKMPSYRLSLAVYFLYVSLMLTQGGMWFELDVFMVLVFVKLEFESAIFKKAVEQRKVLQGTIKAS